ncbi:MAG: M18 family aminopeptidase [Muribaculaceae bacterium]|nr:M18 family aminopeptidase [Muribaculaceae bacterium]
MKTSNSRHQVDDLKDFLDKSPCNFYAAANVAEKLDAAGFRRLDAAGQWTLERGGKYYITKNDTAVFAFCVGTGEAYSGYKIISAHSDSPGFRIKPNAAMMCDGGIIKLNTEVYGGPILYTWFDRPLSIAGRVVLRGEDALHPRAVLVNFRRPLLTIPHLAIHFNRNVNDGNKLSRQKDMLPVIAQVNGQLEAGNFVAELIAAELGIEVKDILDFDLTLYDVTPAMTLGCNDEFITSGRIDDLSMVHAAVTALIAECDTPSAMTRVVAIFDNEETGSGTKQGAASPVLCNLLSRFNTALGGDSETMFRAIANSFMVSADNAHGVHPNYAEKHDPTNHPVLGGGPVIKINANCKYMTDADSAAVFRVICEEAGVPYQYFVNHSDVAGGSTLGNILTSQIDIRGVDMGAAQWAMHSVRETASVRDHEYIIKAFSQFFK